MIVMCELHVFAIFLAFVAAQYVQEDFLLTKEGDADACSGETCSLFAQCLPIYQFVLST